LRKHMNKSSLLERLHNLQALLSGYACEAFLIEDGVNLYYMTALELSRGSLIIHKDGARLFVDGRYEEVCRQHCPFDVASDKSMDAWLKEQKSFDILAFDPEEMTYARYLEWLQKVENLPITFTPSSKDQGALSPIKAMRLIKDADEIALLKDAASMGSQGYDFVLSLLEEGVSETFVAAELEIFWKRHGAKGLSFDPIIAFGSNTSKPHHRPGSATLKQGDLVLIDIGVDLGHYKSDMTRTVAFGPCVDVLQKIHAIVLKAQLAALALLRPGVLIADIDDAARAIISEHGYGDKFPHSLGHGVGLEIHEAPLLRKNANSTCLEAGMVITIEPGIYIPMTGGVRIEDTVLITPSGYEDLTLRSKELVY
jgi:Xaa-Pro aminopeptidase